MEAAIFVIWIGAVLVVLGLISMAYQTLRRGRLSGTEGRSRAVEDGTLEPRRHGLGFLGLSGNWPGLALMGAGFLLMLVGALLLNGATITTGTG